MTAKVPLKCQTEGRRRLKLDRLSLRPEHFSILFTHHHEDQILHPNHYSLPPPSKPCLFLALSIAGNPHPLRLHFPPVIPPLPSLQATSGASCITLEPYHTFIHPFPRYQNPSHLKPTNLPSRTELATTPGSARTTGSPTTHFPGHYPEREIIRSTTSSGYDRPSTWEGDIHQGRIGKISDPRRLYLHTISWH
jgi:hypothetical protein